MKKRLTALLSAAAMLMTSSLPGAAVQTTAADGSYNYASALQLSLFFYECQQAGHLPEWNRVSWKGDSNTSDEIDGGWYDAGDHVKFNLPMAYSASMLAWGLYQYPDGVEKSGEMTNYVNNLEFVLDYFVRCDKGDTVVFQVGNGTIDHTWWGCPELYEYAMEESNTSYAAARETLEASEGCSCVFGGMAAALAAGYCALDGRVDDTKRAGYLKTSKHLFEMADASRSDEVYNNSNAADGFYRSSHFYDELFYASNWLYKATGDDSYLDKAASYIPNLDKERGQDCLKYTWCHCWDDTMQGAMLLYAQNTGKQEYIDHVQKHLDYLCNKAERVDGKLVFIDGWGCARYAQTAGFITAVASDTVLKDQDTSDYVKFYEQQINYVLGDNPKDFSYVVGYGDSYPKCPHHRTAHGSWKNAEAIPKLNRHTLYGALVGGPKQDGSYEDDRGNYINNEVATDYNAGFTALLCKMTDKYGGKTDPAFPPVEQHDGPEFFVEASVNGDVYYLRLTNHSAWPARIQDNLSFRYYIDLSEKGGDPSAVTLRCDYNQSTMYGGKGYTPAEVSELKHYDGDIYYVEVTFPDGRVAMPISEGMQQCEIQMFLSGQDTANDFSFTDLSTAKPAADAEGKTTGIVSKYIPVYINGELYYGAEPDGTEADGSGGTASEDPNPTEKPTEKSTEAPTDQPTEAPTEKPTGDTQDIEYGDVDESGEIDIIDVIALNKNLLMGEELTEQGKRNADVNRNGQPDEADSLAILQYKVGIIKKLPLSAE